MNWYKRANLWDDIKKHGPKGGGMFPTHDTFSYDEGEYENLVQHIQKKFNMSREGAEEYVRGGIGTSRRDYFINNYGWSVPVQSAITKLKGFVGDNTVLSVGSGYGLWSKLLQDAGINVVATTLAPEEGDVQMPRKDHSFTDVENLSHSDAINKYPQANVLMMSWPPYSDPMAYESLKNFRGNKLIYIGEGYGGCTGCDDFHNLLENKWKDVGVLDIPQWQGIHDDLRLFVRQ